MESRYTASNSSTIRLPASEAGSSKMRRYHPTLVAGNCGCRMRLQSLCRTGDLQLHGALGAVDVVPQDMQPCPSSLSLGSHRISCGEVSGYTSHCVRLDPLAPMAGPGLNVPGALHGSAALTQAAQRLSAVSPRFGGGARMFPSWFARSSSAQLRIRSARSL